MRIRRYTLYHDDTKEIKNTSNSRDQYISKHGYHFTDSLAQYASELMVNANGKKHTWNSADLRLALNNMKLELPDHVTVGDVTYLANMAYADFYPDLLKDDAQCFIYAYKVAIDPDGYEGMIMRRWLSDVEGKELNINWQQFV